MFSFSVHGHPMFFLNVFQNSKHRLQEHPAQADIETWRDGVVDLKQKKQWSFLRTLGKAMNFALAVWHYLKL